MPDEIASLLKLAVSFFVVLVLIYGIYYYLNRITPKLLQKKGRFLKIIEISFFSKNKGFVLIEIKNSIMLFSFDEKEIKKIKEWEKKKSEISG